MPRFSIGAFFALTPLRCGIRIAATTHLITFKIIEEHKKTIRNRKGNSRRNYYRKPNRRENN